MGEKGVIDGACLNPVRPHGKWPLQLRRRGHFRKRTAPLVRAEGQHGVVGSLGLTVRLALFAGLFCIQNED